MSTEETCYGTGCEVGSGGQGQTVLHPAETLVVTQHWASHNPFWPRPPESPFFQPQFSHPSLPPLPCPPHLDQLDMRFEPLQAGLQGPQQ